MHPVSYTHLDVYKRQACANEKIPIPEPNFSAGKVSDAIAKQHVAVNALALPSSCLLYTSRCV